LVLRPGTIGLPWLLVTHVDLINQWNTTSPVHTGEQISMVLDLSVSKQTYVEDCEVCCNPIEISYASEWEELIGFVARVLG
jgi:hypothetical protein